MDPITISIVILFGVTTYAVDRYIRKKRKDKQIELIKVNSDVEYKEAADVELINTCRQYFKQRFNNRYEAIFSNCSSAEERRDRALQVAYELAHMMNIDVDEISIMKFDDCTNGSADYDGNSKQVSVSINAMLLDDPTQFVKTLCHEFMHCVQYNSINDASAGKPNRWGYSFERVALWLYNINNYKRCDSPEDYFEYRTQPIENEANWFSDSVINNKI